MLASKSASTAALIGAAALVLAACGDDSADAPATAATVNGTEIAGSDVEALAGIFDQNPQPEQVEGVDEEQIAQQNRADALSQLIYEVVLQDGAAELGIEVTEEDVDQAREEIAVQYGGDPEEMYAQFEEQGLDRDEVDRQLGLMALQNEVMANLGGEVTDEAVQEAYDEGTPARHIIVEEEAQAADAYERIQNGEDFADVAQETSTDGTAEQGGDLGFVQPGTTVPEFEDALFEADEGEVVGPVESQFGFHVIQRLDKPELAEVEEEIRTQLEQLSMQEGQMAFQQFINEQMQAAEIEVDPHYGTWSSEMGQVMPDDPVQPEQPQLPDDQPVPDEQMPDEQPPPEEQE